MAVTRYDTAANLINQAAQELGFLKVQDPFQSSDPKFIQLCALLTKEGRKLAAKTTWKHLITEWTFVTDGVKSVYALPADWIDMIPQTGWNRTSRLPLGGPLDAQEWQYVKAWAMGLSITVLFRQGSTELSLYPQPPPAGATIAMEYRSSAWVVPAAKLAAAQAINMKTLGPVDGADAPVAQGDVCLIDPGLLVAALKLAFLTEKGFDTTAADAEFKDLYNTAISRQADEKVLSLNGPRLGLPGARLLGVANLPPTGYGQ